MLKTVFSKVCLLGVLLFLGVGVASADWKTAVDAYQREDWSMAIENLREIVEAHPDYAPAQNLLGLSLMAAGKMDEAGPFLRRAVSLQPEEASYSLGLAQFLLKNQDASGAWDVLQGIDGSSLKSSRLGPFRTIFLSAATQTAHFAEAIDFLRSILSSDGSNATLWAELGRLYLKAQQPEKAFDALKKASDLNPSNPEVARNALRVGVNAAISAQGGEAQEIWQASGELGDRLCGMEGSAENWKLTGEAWLGAEDYTRALPPFQKAQGMLGSDPMLHYYLSICLGHLERLDEAEDQVEAGIQASAENASLLKRLYKQAAYLADLSHRFEDAIVWYKKLGDHEKVIEMQEKLEQKKSNDKAIAACLKLKNQIEGLRIQIKALENLGEVRGAEQVERKLNDLEGQYARDCRESS